MTTVKTKDFWGLVDDARKVWESDVEGSESEERILDVLRDEQSANERTQARFRFRHELRWDGGVDDVLGDLVAESVVRGEENDPNYYAIRFLPENNQFVVNCPGVMPAPLLVHTLQEAKRVAQRVEDDLLERLRPCLDEPEWLSQAPTLV